MKLKKTLTKTVCVSSTRTLRSSTLAKRLSLDSSEIKDIQNSSNNSKSKNKINSKVTKRKKINGSKLQHKGKVKLKQCKKVTNIKPIENIKLAPIFVKSIPAIKVNKTIELIELSPPVIPTNETFNHLTGCHIQQLPDDFPNIENFHSKFNFLFYEDYKRTSSLNWTGLLGITDNIEKEIYSNVKNISEDFVIDLSDTEDFITNQNICSYKRKKKQHCENDNDIQKVHRKKKIKSLSVNVKDCAANDNNIEDERYKLWVEKHKPETSENVIDNSKAIQNLKVWLNYWKNKNLESVIEETSSKNHKNIDFDYELSNDSEIEISNCTIIYGPSGSGKTNLVYCLAQELGFKVLEVNASSSRNGRQITAQLREATQSHHVEGETLSLDKLLKLQAEKLKAIKPSKSKLKKKKTNTIKDFWNGSLSPEDFKFGKVSKSSEKKKKEESSDKVSLTKGLSISSLSVILFDDVDVIFDEDEGFWNAVNAFLRTSKIPVILTASNHLHSVQCNINLPYELVTLQLPTVESMSNHVRSICLKENLEFDLDKIQQIISYIGCDIRKLFLQLQYWYSAHLKCLNQFKSDIQIENNKYQNFGKIMDNKSIVSNIFDVILGIKNKNDNFIDLKKYFSDFVNIVHLAYHHKLNFIHTNLPWLLIFQLECDELKNENFPSEKSEETFIGSKKTLAISCKKEKNGNKNTMITSYFQTKRKKNETAQLKIGLLEAVANLTDKISLSDVLMHPAERQCLKFEDCATYSSITVDAVAHLQALSLKQTRNNLEKVLNDLPDQSRKLFSSPNHERASNHIMVKYSTECKIRLEENIKCSEGLRNAIPPVTRLQRTAICTDYLSYVRSICKLEKVRQAQNLKRLGRFLHYLDSISLLLDKDTYYILHK
ncbi:ATPase family AAA domain-containing protein 5 [Centruroides vittatus]|uniref:ATPase family AAA domain-containing protein 5 n=1 Tax=Centruroides vittatus TaxID=120091 RepID=UPI00350F1180